MEETKKYFPCKDCENVMHISVTAKQCKLTGEINAYGICPLKEIEALKAENERLKTKLKELEGKDE